jgi:serine-type D-Ala-D-Ala carboxypeptidase/endopeptidase (penicillin-binding protein 4)
MHKPFWLCLLLLLPGLGLAQGFELKSLAALKGQGIDVSAEIVNLSQGRFIGALNPDQRLLPASVTKLYTAAAALQQWGGAHTFKTRLLMHGRLRGDTLQGDLILLGSGDPTFDHDDLARLAAQLRSRGVRRVTGKLVVNTSLFGTLKCITHDRCEAREYSRNSYDAPLSAAGVDFSNVGVAIIPALEAGHPAIVKLEPHKLPMFRIRGRVRTVDADRDPHVGMVRSTRDGHDILYLTGSVPAGSQPLYLYRSVSDPNRFTGELLKAELQQAGIRIDGGLTMRTATPAGDDQLLAEVDGLPLGEQLRQMMTYSNNYIADMLALDLLRTESPDQAPSLEAAGARLAAFAEDVNTYSRFACALSDPGLTLFSGSGLTIENRLSARDLIALLDHMYLRYADFPAFLGALTVPDQTPVKTLKENGNNAWLTRIAAKTGTLSDPYPVFSLAGYFRFTNGEWGAFAVLINDRSGHHRIDRNQALAAVRSDIERLLASH